MMKPKQQKIKEGPISNPADFPAITISPRAKDLIGKVYGRLTVIRPVGREPGKSSSLWLCSCDCGKWTIVSVSHLNTGNTTSCGCYMLDYNRMAHTSHGQHGTPAYVSCKTMLDRYRRPKHSKYYCYGGRGTKPYNRWGSFESFLEDMGTRPEGHSLDRKNVNGNYEPDNCRWATGEVQANNKRNSKKNRTLPKPA